MANKFWPIIDNWKEYFDTLHEGLGTTYERLLLHQMFEEIADEFSIGTVLEAPSFGMTGVSGINSSWWYFEQGIVPVVLDDSSERVHSIQEFLTHHRVKLDVRFHSDWSVLPFGDRSFDLSWNFASLWFIPDWELLIPELLRITGKVILISIPNTYNIGFLMRKFLFYKDYRRIARKPLPSLGRIKDLLKHHRWEVWKEGYFDTPPWPDFPVQKEKIFPWLKRADYSSETKRMFFLDYWEDSRKELADIVKQYGFLEKPIPLWQQIWSHHRYLIGVRQ